VTFSYLDSSALTKLVIVEAESAALRGFLTGATTLASSSLASVEVIRAVRPHGLWAVTRGRSLLRSIELLALSNSILGVAGELDPPLLRSLDAIHIATALSLGEQLDELVTYDRRMQAAALAVGLRVAAPA
jgi:hypothetical protein